MATRVDSLSLSTERDGFTKFKCRPPAPSQRLLKLKSASSLVPSNSVTEPVADLAMMAIRVDNLSWAAEHAGSDKPKHGPPASNQRSLKIAEDLLQRSRHGLSNVSKATAAIGKRSASIQVRSVRFEPTFLGDHAVMSGLA